jgi:hypothetical protein
LFFEREQRHHKLGIRIAIMSKQSTWHLAYTAPVGWGDTRFGSVVSLTGNAGLGIDARDNSEYLIGADAIKGTSVCLAALNNIAIAMVGSGMTARVEGGDFIYCCEVRPKEFIWNFVRQKVNDNQSFVRGRATGGVRALCDCNSDTHVAEQLLCRSIYGKLGVEYPCTLRKDGGQDEMLKSMNQPEVSPNVPDHWKIELQKRALIRAARREVGLATESDYWYTLSLHDWHFDLTELHPSPTTIQSDLNPALGLFDIGRNWNDIRNDITRILQESGVLEHELVATRVVKNAYILAQSVGSTVTRTIESKDVRYMMHCESMPEGCAMYGLTN